MSLDEAGDRGFNGRVSRCIERAVATMGVGVMQSLYYRIEREYGLPREQMASRPEAVIEHLKDILGPTGYALVERLIVKEIRKDFSLDFRENMPLTAALKQAKSKFLNVADVD